MISQNSPFLQPPQPNPLMYPLPFGFFGYSPYSFGIPDPMYQSQLYKRENPYSCYDVRLPANNSQKRLKTQNEVSQVPASQLKSSDLRINQMKAVPNKTIQKVINLEDDDDDEDLIIIDDEEDVQKDSQSLCVKDAVFQQMSRGVAARAPPHQEPVKQRIESGDISGLYSNSQFPLNPSGANFNSRCPGFLHQSQPKTSFFDKRIEPLVIPVDDDEERSDSNMSFDSLNKPNLAVSICISNNDHVFTNSDSTPKKTDENDAQPQLNSSLVVRKIGYHNQIKIKNINISFFQPCSQFDKDTSTTIPESFNTASESLSLPDNQGAINFEDSSETQSEIFQGAADKSPTAFIPVLNVNKVDKNRSRRNPKLIWDPKDLERETLEQYYSDLTKVTRKEITNEVVALNSLRMSGMDVSKTLELVKQNRAIYRDLFTVKPHLNTIKK